TARPPRPAPPTCPPRPRAPPRCGRSTSRRDAMTAVSSFFGLNTALRGLLAHQRALDTTAHNIGNASTEGYSRQQTQLAAADPLSLASVTGGGAALRRARLAGGGVRRARAPFAAAQERAPHLAVHHP